MVKKIIELGRKAGSNNGSCVALLYQPGHYLIGPHKDLGSLAAHPGAITAAYASLVYNLSLTAFYPYSPGGTLPDAGIACPAQLTPRIYKLPVPSPADHNNTFLSVYSFLRFLLPDGLLSRSRLIITILSSACNYS